MVAQNKFVAVAIVVSLVLVVTVLLVIATLRCKIAMIAYASLLNKAILIATMRIKTTIVILARGVAAAANLVGSGLVAM